MTEGRAPRSRLTRRRSERRAEREAKWFYGTLGGQVPEAGPARETALALQGRLQSTTAFDRGALSLRYAKKDWPAPIQEEFGNAASLVVRLECAMHPSVGASTEALEAEAVRRLCARIARRSDSDEALLARLFVRAKRHCKRAIRALAKTRETRASGAEEAFAVSQTTFTADGALAADETFAADEACAADEAFAKESA
jgi:hypothetical protein